MEPDFLSLKRLLEMQPVDYEIICHTEPIRSAQQGAEFLGIAIGQTAPVLIVDTDQGYRAVAMSGDRRRLDFAALARCLECQRVAMASRDDVKRLTGHTPGDLPLVGLELPYVLDTRLHAYSFVYGGTGFPGSTLKIEPAALEKLNQVVGRLGTGDDYVL
ncbi:MAG TPA: YbaK/EbsC family protein [Patescibacteria group bacterium]|nr:YbaK/EbsC family protein [Patescibacteria group bacterium]